MSENRMIFSVGVFLFPGPAVQTVYGNKHYLAECGCCGGFHPFEFLGDCRDNANRYNDEQEYATRNGVPLENIEISPTDDAEAA